MTPGEMADRLDLVQPEDVDCTDECNVDNCDRIIVVAAAAMLREAERLLKGAAPRHVPGSAFARQWELDRGDWLVGGKA